MQHLFGATKAINSGRKQEGQLTQFCVCVWVCVCGGVEEVGCLLREYARGRVGTKAEAQILSGNYPGK